MILPDQSRTARLIATGDTPVFGILRFWLALALGLVWAGQAFAKHPAHDEPKEPPTTKHQVTEHSLMVTAFAYSADSSQTDGSEDIGAWGDELDKKVPSIAVSRDLLALGLKRGTKVRIKGLPGEYVVLDLMNTRWKKSIDIFKARKKEARRWGRRRVRISWETKTAVKPGATSGQKTSPVTAAPHHP